MNILITICGRAGSKGIKEKNVREFLGYPLPYFTLSAIDLYKQLDPSHQIDVVVNTDSQRLIQLSQENPFVKTYIIQREESLGGDLVPKTDVIRNCLEQMEQRLQCKYDMVVDLDLTSPLRKVEDIKNLIDTHIEKKPEITFSVTDSRRNPYFNMVKETPDGYKRVIESNFVARQQAPIIYDMNASMYAYNPQYFGTGKALLAAHCQAIKMTDTAVLDLDHEGDFELMQVIAEYLFRKDRGFAEIYENIQKHQ